MNQVIMIGKLLEVDVDNKEIILVVEDNPFFWEMSLNMIKTLVGKEDSLIAVKGHLNVIHDGVYTLTAEKVSLCEVK